MTYPAEELVHEGYRLDGRLGYMKCDILQEPFWTLSEVLDKCNRYSSLGAEELAKRSFWRGFIGLVHGIAYTLSKFYFFKWEFSMADQN